MTKSNISLPPDSLSLLSKEELLAEVSKLQKENAKLNDLLFATKTYVDGKDFKRKFTSEIFNSLPDMLTVLTRSGDLVSLISSEETNHVGVASEELEGRHISTILDPEAYESVMGNIERVAETRKTSVSHHSITLDGVIHHYENRISPLEGDYYVCMCRDVTDETTVKKELESSNMRMKMAETIANAGHCYYYPETKELEIPSIIPLLFPEQEQRVRCNLDDYMAYVFEEDRDVLRNQLFGKIDSAKCVEHRLRLSSGVRYLHTRTIRFNNDGSELVVEGYIQDMTYMVERMVELEQIKYAVNNSSDLIFAVNREGAIRFANSQLVRAYGLQPPYSAYRIYNSLNLGLRTQTEWFHKIDEIRANGGSLNYVVKKENTMTGTIEAYDVVSYIVNEHSDQFEAWFFLRNISERVARDRSIRELHHIMDAVLNNIPVYLFVKDPSQEFRYRYWNKAFEEFSGISSKVALGHTDFEIFPCIEEAQKFREDDLRLLHGGDRLEFIEDYTSKTGKKRVVKTIKTLIPIEKKMPLIIGVSWDITDMKSTESELIKAKMKAEQSDQLKSAFLANMSHEIRTPLNAIVGFSKLMATVDDPEEKMQYTDIIDTNAELLLQLINDILDLSKIEAGTLEFVERPMDLSDLCRNIYEINRNKVKPGVTLILDDHYKRVGIISDQNRISQVIINLLNNAIKFTTEGEIRFGFEVIDQSIRLFVKDTGVGIPKEKLAAIFERFVKLDKFVQGTGLGLSITKMIIAKLGGHIAVESEDQKGTLFTITIPYVANGLLEAKEGFVNQ